MKNPFKKQKNRKEELIERWLEDASFHDAGSEEATRARENIVGLIELDQKDKCKLDPNTFIEGGFSLAGIALLCNFEKITILPKNALGLAMKLFKK